MKLVIGLGNPGKKYKYTPHNIGFLMIDFFLSKMKEKNIIFFKQKEFDNIYFIEINNQRAILFKPQKYMNLSGIEIKKIVSNYKLDINDILVLSDDIYLEKGKFKLKDKGGHGGHNGLRNIIDSLYTNSFKRLKIGVGYDSESSIEEYVLKTFNNEDIKKITINFELFLEILISFICGMSFEKIVLFSKKKI
ncbi:aminoacyl-tRNA hydrolase [Candidatus Phytoplasma sacchari]|uniref:Peptidyl-tRNA hydrolase n=1 Tax=Candidatus Phytoplasma sacchari TaxID=2609813 RepID=A0ABY7M459_9MOLU|nr:aminoacyl-tRNA hydrolase [Candidatus Phytoplasma sacchari]